MYIKVFRKLKMQVKISVYNCSFTVLQFISYKKCICHCDQKTDTAGRKERLIGQIHAELNVFQ